MQKRMGARLYYRLPASQNVKVENRSQRKQKKKGRKNGKKCFEGQDEKNRIIQTNNPNTILKNIKRYAGKKAIGL